LTIKSTVELEAVNEQLRLRKEKQYQLLGKLQSQEEASRQAEDRIKELEQNIKDLRQQSSELQTALQLETSARISQDTSIRTLTIDFQATSTENKELRSIVQELEQVRLKLEAEARANGFVTTSYNPSAAWVSIKKQRIEPSATEVSVETKLAADAIDESRPQIAPPMHAWICDKCRVAKFRTLSEASAHEDICSFVDTLSV
jgi:chromosome segregation ATPase